MGATARSPLRTWMKVLVVLVGLDWLLFHAGLFFWLVPALRRYPVTWGLVYRCVRTLEAPPPGPRAYAVGSSIVFLGLDELHVRKALAERGVPTAFSSLTVFGTTGPTTRSGRGVGEERLVGAGRAEDGQGRERRRHAALREALLAHAAARNAPWVVVLTGSIRDFPVKGSLDTPVARVFNDASVRFAPLAGHDVEDRLAGVVRRYWGLYRYRFFVRTALLEAATDLVSRTTTGIATPPPPPGPLAIPSASGAPVPEEAFERFFPGRVTAESWAAWTHWRETRRFADYEEFLRLNRSAAIDQYGKQTFATHGPDGNVQLDAMAWAEGELRAAGIRVVVLAFPENPVLQDPDAQALYDTALSDAVTGRLEADARANGARFADLRRLLAPEDFYDLIHPNLAGSRKLSLELATILDEEWKAAGR